MDIKNIEKKEVPLRYQISYKEGEKLVIYMEDVPMKHFQMGRSDLHKYFIRVNYNLLKNPNPFFAILP